jgi:hypothetical protein
VSFYDSYVYALWFWSLTAETISTSAFFGREGRETKSFSFSEISWAVVGSTAWEGRSRMIHQPDIHENTASK